MSEQHIIGNMEFVVGATIRDGQFVDVWCEASETSINLHLSHTFELTVTDETPDEIKNEIDETLDSIESNEEADPNSLITEAVFESFMRKVAEAIPEYFEIIRKADDLGNLLTDVDLDE